MGIKQGEMATTMLDIVRRCIDGQSGVSDMPAFTYLDNGQDISSSLTYAELDQKARVVAVRLQSIAQQGDRVLIGFPPGMDFVVAFFGCIYAGVVAVPAAPPANARTMPRLLGIVEDAEVHVILSTGADLARLQRLWREGGRAESEVVWLSVDDTPVDADQWSAPRLTPDALAFIQYTSGSTGRPKGVMVSHRSLLANLAHIQSSYGVRENDTLVSWLPQHHDFGLIGFTLLPVFVRAHVVLFPPAVFLMRPLRWLELISRYSARVTGAPNFAFDLCVKRISPVDRANLDLGCLELAINGADRVRPRSMRQFVDAFREYGFDGRSLAPSYGLAESTLLVCASRQHDHDGSPKSIGISRDGLGRGVAVPPRSDDDVMEMVACGPATSRRHHILIVDGDQQPLADQRIGEIWVTGASLGDGYWNKPEASETTFGAIVPGDSRRYLRTGDLGFVADGHLYVSGRLKEMMIFQGRNVFSHDVEATVEAQDAAFRANGCAAFSVEREHGAELVVVQELESRATPNLEGLAGRVRTELAEGHDIFDLTELMLVKAGQLPRTSSGKIQRVKCRELYLGGQFDTIWSWRRDREAAADLAVGSATRDWVTRNWESMLGMTELGPDADFFAIGGHSLIASQMISRVRDELGVDLSLRDFFENPSIQGIAAAIERQRGAAETSVTRPPLRLASRQQLLQLSWPQQRLWFLDQLDSAASLAYHLPVALKLDGVLDGVALCRALDYVVARHEVLRTVFPSQDGLPVQLIGPVDSGFALEKVDLRGLDKELVRTEVARRSDAEARTPFDLSQGPLVRGKLLQLAEHEHVLLITQHHIVSDGWSARIFIRDLATAYDAFLTGGVDPLPALSVQYADYAMWQHEWLQGEELTAQLNFWKRHLADAPAMLDLPTDRPRPMAQDYRGGSVEVQISSKLTAGLRGLAQAHGATLYMVLLAAWSALLARLSGQRDVVIGTPVANRQHIDIEPLVGFFVNTLALRVRLDDMQTTAELLHQVKASAIAAFAHQDVPFEQVVEAINPQRSLGHNPLFQTMLAFNNTPQEHSPRLAGLSVSLLKAEHFTTHFDLSLSLEEDGDGLGGSLVYATALFDATSVESHRDYLRQLLEAMVADAQRPVARIDLLPAHERELLLHTWNQTESPYPVDRCIHQLFEEQAALCPDAIAVVHDDVHLTYSELNREANRLAHELIALGVRPDRCVAICADRRLHMVVGLLGILKAGGAYVPLDPAYPADRLHALLDDAQPLVLLADAAGRHVLEGLTADGLLMLALDEPTANTPHSPTSNPDPEVLGLTSSHLAYVIYTSGSTGRPKGVMIEHGNTANLLLWARQTFSANETARTLFATSINFDLSIYECFLPLIQGSALLLVKDALSLIDAPQDVSIINTVPSALTALLEAGGVPASVRTINLAGEPLTASLARAILERTTARRLCNLYGPSETTTYSTWIELHPGQPVFESIGRPIANTRIYLLDTYGQPVPRGVVGELYIGGAGVARGYLNRPDLTAERFLRDPFVADVAARMYRTGDLARYLPDGNLEFHGRNDHQVKIRGFRIELGEIEARLAEHGDVREAVVIAREDMLGEKRLVAYVTARLDATIEALDLRSHLARQLPDYMLPSAIVSLKNLPRTPNGKLDRNALPPPDGEILSNRQYEAPQGDIERRLADLWSELLGVESVSRHDHFFELGGHSLLGVQLVGRLRQAGLGVQIKALFEHPVLASLAAKVGNLHDMEVPLNGIEFDSTAITPEMLPLIDLTVADIEHIVTQVPGGATNIQDIYALSPLQEGILFHHRVTTAGDPYVLANQIVFSDGTKMERFLDAVQQVIDRHDILRSAFLWEGVSEPAQVVWRKAPLSVTEISLDTDHGAGTASEQLARRFDPRHSRMDLTRAPALQFFVAQETDSPRWVMQCLQHHLVTDHSTLESVYKEVICILDGQRHSLAPPEPFRNLVMQTRLGAELHEPFFSEMLGDIDEPTLPFGLSDVHLDGHDVGECHRLLPAGLNDRLRDHARRLGVSLASFCHLAFGQVLARCSTRESVVFGTVLLGRMRGGEGADRTIGPFVNTLPIRLDLDDTPIEQSVRQTHQRLAGLLEHEHASLAQAQRCSGVPSPTPLFSALLNYRHNLGRQALVDVESMAFDGIDLGSGQERTNYPFALAVEDDGQSLGLTPQVVGGVSPEHVCDLMQSALEHLVETLERSPTMPVRRLNVLSMAERDLLLHTWNQTDAPYPTDRCIHHLFEDQVAKTPDAIAVIQDEVQLTYAQLNAQANQLAHYLIALGVRPDSRVGLCVDRRPHMVIGLLAILKAGGAYVPMDPAYPIQRLRELLDDAEPVLLLTDAIGRHAVDGHTTASLPTLALDELPIDALGTSDANPDANAIGLASSHLAYLIYTSGSTGRPKGVMIEHGNAANLLQWASHSFTADETAHSLFSTSINFDLSVYECFLPLAQGTTLHLAENALSLARAPQDVSIINTVPSALTALLDAGAVPGSIRTINLAGEPLKASLIKAIFERTATQRLCNLYGPSETTTYSTWTTFRPGEPVRESIGRPIANTRVYVLDGHGEPVPLGAVGELFIGGAGVARGYLNQPELTAERFLADPFATDPTARMYRTGDLARYRPDGTLDYLGRNDHQVKIRGFRVELGEIEERLSAHSAIREVAVLAREDVTGGQRLIAYVTVQPDIQIEAADLREHVMRQLPEYMVPSAFVQLDMLPLTPNGKLDRNALPAPGGEALAHRSYEAPVGEREAIIAGIWSDLLGVDRIGRHDHFFELGGHSLLAIRVLERLRRQGLIVATQALFTHSTLSEVARLARQFEEF